MSTDAIGLELMQRNFEVLCQYRSFTHDHITRNFSYFPSSKPCTTEEFTLLFYFSFMFIQGWNISPGRTDGRTDMTKFIAAFGSFTNVPKKELARGCRCVSSWLLNLQYKSYNYVKMCLCPRRGHEGVLGE
jgi:hypothetical protein